MTDIPITRRRALALALGTHAIWGAMPIYLMLVKTVPPLEYIAWRTLFTLPICLVFAWYLARGNELRATLTSGRTMRTLVASASAIAVNWYVYVWAIQTDHVYAASLGYYILPLVMMLMGLVFLGEKLSRWQTVAVALAALGVAALAAGALTTLWVSMTLGLSFGIYGLLRKTVAAGPLTGLAVESMILAPLAAGYLAWAGTRGDGLAIGRDGWETFGIVMGGPMTAVPLLMFATATRALPYTVIGFLQFASPTIIFILGLTFFGEELKPAQLACFVAIWIAASIFTWDLLRGSRRARQALPVTP
ncbi:EamA family transporter RarD [Erythrobacter arachoides]|uniref:EamA family transporter RarD n=1 Tax=Aurantiacibacter arachoides TaxID=1850444 RepID=A0A845A2U9_9SPHN|nr:EamA family transporter RarD [Aurantiacibacter arachoides]MXO93742.1 EamA family transporter RarD [Aurantiacibacter arachoides]GGD46968.1 permease [Aurantiacibacter arachoides]